MKRRMLWIVLILFFLLFSLSPMFYEFSQKDKLVGRTFEPVHNYITDYNFYLSRIREGMEGRWTVVERYTSEPHNGSFVQIFYLLLGKPVSFFPDKAVGANIAYHGARILFGLLFLYLVSRVCQKLFRPFLWQVVAFLIIVTASSIPIIVSIEGAVRFGGYMSWWTVMDSLQRITFLPHLLLGQSLIIALLCDIYDEKKLDCGKLILLKFVLAFVLGLVFPPGFLFVAIVYVMESLLEVSSSHFAVLTSAKQRLQWMEDDILPRIAVVSGGIPTMVYYALVMMLFPWKRLIEFDVLHPTSFSLMEYGKSVGLPLIFGIGGGILSLVAREKRMVVMVAWVIAWMLCIVLFRSIPQQSPLRFTEMAPQVPLGILTAYLFYECTLFLQRLFKKAHLPARYFLIGIKTLSFVLPICIIVLGIGTMYSSFLWQKDFINQKVGAGWPAVSMKNVMVYPVSGFIDALSFIEKETPAGSIILSDLTAGNYIPAYTGRRVYVGHDNTFKKEEKVYEMQNFFGGAMTAEEVQLWLTQNSISYVFYGPQEKEYDKDIVILYPFLHEVYKNNDVTLYCVSCP